MTAYRLSLCLALSVVASAGQTFWSASTTPTTPAVTSDRNPVTLGLKFYSDVAGSVTAVRFYKGKQNKGTHTGNLWSETGVKLAEVKFSGETDTGWQQANFPSAVNITANTTYVISYTAPGGAYALDQYYSWTSVNASPLHVSGTSPGSFTYGAGSTFPTNSRNGNNYWVDVVFVPAAPQALYSISGAITPSAAAAGAALKLTGPVTTTVTADQSGNYTFPGLPNGTYTLVPAKPGIVFTPQMQTVTINGSNGVANFAAAAQTWNLSGAITPLALGSATTLSLSGAATAQVTADSSGNYSFAGLANGTYTITPTKTGVTFSPASLTLTINVGPATANFSAAAQTWTISGSVSGSPATLTLSGPAAASTITDGTGKYNFSGLTNGSYVIAASQSGYTFSPSTALVNVNSAPVAAVNFTAQKAPPSVRLSWAASTSGSITGYNLYRATTTGGPYAKLNSSPVAVLTYVDSTVSSGQAYFYVATALDSIGNESTYSSEVAASIPSF